MVIDSLIFTVVAALTIIIALTLGAIGLEIIFNVWLVYLVLAFISKEFEK